MRCEHRGCRNFTADVYGGSRGDGIKSDDKCENEVDENADFDSNVGGPARDFGKNGDEKAGQDDEGEPREI